MESTLYAIPTPLGGAARDALAPEALGIIAGLRHFVVENAKSARAFLKDAGCDPKAAHIVELGAHKDPAALLQPMREGHSIGLLSEAGCPGIADPGAALVAAAHASGFRVRPLPGPSSIVLALMASGLEGQRFAFRGYLPRESGERRTAIREAEARSRKERETQVFIETPYRNDVLLGALLDACAAPTRLCVATDLTLPSEDVRTRRIADWRAHRVSIGKRPTVFLLLA